jgi:hypothetical protein
VVSGVTLSTLVEAALTGRPYHQPRFGDQTKRYARTITNRFCRDFPEDRHEEVANQAVVELFALGAPALAGRSGQALYRRAVFAAIRVVRSDYAAPGRRTRRPARNAPPEPARVAAEDVGRIASRETVERCTVGEGAEAHVEFDLFASTAAAAEIRHAEDKADLDWSLSRAPPDVARALRSVCVQGETVSQAAAQMGLSRFVLTRRMDAFCPLWRDAA